MACVWRDCRSDADGRLTSMQGTYCDAIIERDINIWSTYCTGISDGDGGQV